MSDIEHSVSAVEHVRAARPVHYGVLLLVGIFGTALFVGGVYLAAGDRFADATMKLFGSELATNSVGIALAFIGAVVTVLTIRRVLTSIDHLAGLPRDR